MSLKKNELLLVVFSVLFVVVFMIFWIINDLETGGDKRDEGQKKILAEYNRNYEERTWGR